MKKILYAVAIMLTVVGVMVWYGGTFATNMVSDQLTEQRIYFPASEAEGLPSDLQQYAGQLVDTAPKAKAYADQYIKVHLDKAANGKTYSEVSAEYQKDKSNQTLAAQRQTLFMGETLRGILLNAWGWGLVGMIALYASYAILAVAVLVAVVAYLGVFTPKKKSAKKK